MVDYKPLILIADDELASVEVVRLFLVNEGYRFIHALDGGQALKLAQEQLPDLILLDLNMPVMDGFEILERLQQDPATKSIVVIIMTAAYTQRQHRIRAFELGAHDYLLKPLDRRELAARVRSWLQAKVLEADMLQQREELHSLYRVTQETSTTLNPTKLANKLLTVAGKFIGAEDGWIILVNENGEPISAQRYGGALSPQVAGQLARQSLRQGIGSVVSQTQTGLLIADSAVDERYATGELGLSGIRSIVSVPLIGRRHYRGVLTYAHPEPGRFSDRHLQWLRTAAGQAAVAMDNAYLFAREQRRAVQFRLLNSVTQDMSSVLEMEQLLDVVVNLIQRTFSYYYVGLGLRQEDGVVVRAVAADVEGAERPALIGTQDDSGVVAWVVQNGRPLLVNNVQQDTRYVEKEGLEETRAELALPILSRGEVIGVLDIRSRSINTFDPDDVVMLETLTAQVAIAMQNAQFFHALSDQRERLNAILNSVTNAVLVADEDGRLLLVNPAARRLLNLSEQAIGRKLESGDLGSGLEPYFTKPIPAGETLTGELEMEDELSFQVVATPVVVDGKRAGRAVLLQDITHFRALSQLKDDFVAAVSHDLKNPLAVIQASSYWLAQPDVPNEKRDEMIESIQRSVGRMNNLITQLLELGRLESGMGVELADVDIQPVLQQVMEEFGRQAQQSDLALRLEAPPLPLVHADLKRLRQALSNLLSNAIKYTPAGGTILLQAVPKDDHVLLQVKDSGVGIAPRDQPYIFDKFYRGQASDLQEAEGSGLGLAIVKSIVVGHNGRVWVESEPGKGSTFFLTVPLATNGPPLESVSQ